jgi:hypothetical protein
MHMASIHRNSTVARSCRRLPRLMADRNLCLRLRHHHQSEARTAGGTTRRLFLTDARPAALCTSLRPSRLPSRIWDQYKLCQVRWAVWRVVNLPFRDPRLRVPEAYRRAHLLRPHKGESRSRPRTRMGRTLLLAQDPPRCLRRTYFLPVSSIYSPVNRRRLLRDNTLRLPSADT